MEALRAYLNSLSTADQFSYAQAAGTSVGYLRKALSVGQRFKVELALKLAKHSNGAVTINDMRPDVFGEPDKRKAA